DLARADAGRGRRLYVEAGDAPGHAIQTIEVVVLDRDTALVVVVQNKGRAMYAARDAQGLRDALHQLRLSRAEVTFERDNVTGLEDLCQSAAELAGPTDRRRLVESVQS